MGILVESLRNLIIPASRPKVHTEIFTLNNFSGIQNIWDVLA